MKQKTTPLKCVLTSFLVNSNEEVDNLKTSFSMFTIVVEAGEDGYKYEVMLLQPSMVQEDYDEELDKLMAL